MRVIQIDEGEGAKRWDAYVGPRAIAGTDLFAWRRVVTSTHGLRPWFLAALEGDQVRGTLGLFEAKHPIFGHYLATAPFGNDGGFPFDGEAARVAVDYRTVALRTFDRRCPSYLSYWKRIETWCERWWTQFDMGRSEVGSSSIKFKMNWCPKPQALPYNNYLVRTRSLPRLDHSNP